MADDQIRIAIVLDDGSVKEGFARVLKEGKASADGLSSSFGGLQTKVLGLVAAYASIASIKNFFGAAIDAASGQEAAVNKLNVSLAQAGTYSAGASQAFQDLASQIQRTTTLEDDQVLSLGALARNYARTNEQAMALTKASIDLAAATGQDVESALKSLGGTLTGQAGKLAKNVQGLGQLTEASLKAGGAIDLVASRFAGSAAQQANTFDGRLIQLKNTFGDLLEEIGNIVIKSPALLAVFKYITERVAAAADAVKEFGSGGSDRLRPLIYTLIDIGKVVNMAVIGPLELLWNVAKLIFNNMRMQVQAYIYAVAETASTVVGFFAPTSELAKGLATFAESSKAVLGDFATQTKDSLLGVFDFTATSNVSETLDGIRLAVDNAAPALNNFKNNANGVFKGIGETAKKASFDMKTALGQGISTTIQQTVAALQRGENAFKAFGKSVLGVFGDLAIQLGTFFIINGIAVEALKSLGGAAAVAAGIALIAFGALLKGFSGGGSGGASYTAGQPGSGVPATETPGGVVDDPAESVNDKEKQRVQVVINGSVFDTKETALRIVELAQEAFDTAGAQVRTT